MPQHRGDLGLHRLEELLHVSVQGGIEGFTRPRPVRRAGAALRAGAKTLLLT